MGYTLRILPFLSKLAVICNICYVFSLLFMLYEWAKLPRSTASFFAILGLEMAPFVNLIFAVLIVGYIVKKEPLNLPAWQIIFNGLFLGFQFISLFV